MAITQSPTKIPPALRDALDASKLLSSLEQQGNPLAPGPGGTQVKSVVGGIMDGLQSHMAAQAPAPQSDMGQGIGGVLQQLKNATPILQQQAQNAQVDQIAQRAAEMVQGQGQDQGAPAQGFSEGGILGFAGDDEEGSEVPTPKMPYSEQMKKLLGAALSLPATVVKHLVSAPGYGMQSGTPAAATPTPPSADEANLERVPVAAAPPRPAPAAASRPAPAAGAPTGGLPTVAESVKEAQGVLGASPDIAAARSKAQELSELLKNTPLPGIEAIAALRKGAEDRAALYAKADAELPKRQLQALLLGIHRGGLAGGAEAVAQVQNEQDKLQANRIAERQLEAMKLQTLIDAQNASKIGDKKLELDAYDRLAKLATDQNQIVGNLAGHAYTAKMSYAGHELQARTQKDIANQRFAQALQIAKMKPEPGARLSASDIEKIKSDVSNTFYSPMAAQSQDFRKYIMLANKEQGAQLINDILKGREKFVAGKGWSPAASNVIDRAAELYRNDVIRSIGPTATHGGTQPMPYETALSMLGG